MNKHKFLLFFCFFYLVSAQAQSDFTVMAYNTLNFKSTSSDRTSYFKTVLDAYQPDILVFEEIDSEAGLNLLKSQSLNSFYASGTYIANSTHFVQTICYRINKFKFVSNTPISTNVRDINQFTLVHLETGDTLRVFGLHLKAGSLESDAAQRLSEIQELRKVTDKFTDKQHYIVVGDFNFYGSDETAYQLLKSPNGTVNGNIVDPLNLTGTWNNPSYAKYHTQSPRTRSFGGGVTGGMDDRFDLILYSKSISDVGELDYVENSLTAIGNDGNHYNDSVNKMPNTSVTETVANALHYASDHLPVMATFRYVTGGISSLSQTRSAVYPNPTTGKISIQNLGNQPTEIQIVSTCGKLLKRLSSQNDSVELDLSPFEVGTYFIHLVVDGVPEIHRVIRN